MGGGARVQAVGRSILEESCAEPPAMALGHGHVPCRSVDDVASVVWLVFSWFLPAVVMWWWSIGGRVVW